MFYIKMYCFPRKTFWKIGSSKRFLLNDFLSFSQIWLALMSFFISRLLLTPDLHSFLGLSIPVCLHPSLSSIFFFSQGSHRLTAETFPERLKKRHSAPSWHVSICCVCVMISGLTFGFTEQAMETFWPSV